MTAKGPSGAYPGTTGDLTDGGGFRLVRGFPTKLHEGRQGKHIPQHNNYDRDAGRSIFHGSLEDAQRLIEQFAGTGQWLSSNRERVDFHEVIGTHVDRQTGKRSETTVGTIHYSKSGSHIVPARPRKES